MICWSASRIAPEDRTPPENRQSANPLSTSRHSISLVIFGWMNSHTIKIYHEHSKLLSNAFVILIRAVEHQRHNWSHAYDHITPVLRDLHWLPIRQRMVFTLATMVYKCQHGLCPSYLAEDCILLSATRGSAAPAIGWEIGTACSKNTNCDIWPAGFHGGRPRGLEFSVPCSKRTDSLV